MSRLQENLVKCKELISKLKSMQNSNAVAGMARYGINPKNNYGVSVGSLRVIAKEVGRDHGLAKMLWASGIHDARILACIVDDPTAVTEGQMEDWSGGFDSWDVCDQCCINLFSKTKFARGKAAEWSARSKEFVKRAGFVLMASLAVHDRKSDDKEFIEFLDAIEREAIDERNYVKKAINWALRQIGKRNPELNDASVKAAKRIFELDSRSAKWIASDALKELTSDKTRKRIHGRRVDLTKIAAQKS